MECYEIMINQVLSMFDLKECIYKEDEIGLATNAQKLNEMVSRTQSRRIQIGIQSWIHAISRALCNHQSPVIRDEPTDGYQAMKTI